MQLFTAILLCLTVATYSSELDCGGPVEFLTTENPGKILTVFTTLEASGVQNCAAICYKHPFCQAAGYSMVGTKPACILSYGKETCTKGPFVTTKEVKTGDTLLLSCIKCTGDKESQTPLPSPHPDINTTSSSISSATTVITTSGNGTIGNATDGQVQKVPIAHCNDGNVTTQEIVEIGGGVTVSNISQQQSQPVKTTTDSCTYSRYANTGAKYLPATMITPTAVGLITGEKSFLTESHCVQRCNAMETCTAVVYDFGYSTPGFATCQLISPPAQMFTYQPDTTKPDTTVTYIDDIKCGQQTKYFCTYEMEPTGGLYPGYMYLVNSDTFKTPSGHQCATMCYLAGDCSFAVFEVNNHTCYLVNQNSSAAVRAMANNVVPTTSPTQKMLDANGTYYIFSNVTCPSDMYTGGVPKLTSTATCIHKTVDHVDPAKLLNINLFPMAVLTTPYTAEMCAAYCFYDSRCKSALFAATPAGVEALGKAVANAFMYHSADTKCVLMGFNYEDFMAVPIAGVAGLTEANSSLTGVSMIYDLKSCAGTQRKTPCSATVVNGTVSKTVPLPGQGVTPTIGTVQTFAFPVFGPSQCDQICVQMGVGCKSAMFMVDRLNFVCSLHDTDYPANFNMTAETPTVLVRTKISC